MRNFFLLISFFAITPCVLIASVIFFSFRDYQLHQKISYVSIPKTLPHISITYATLPTVEAQFAGSVISADARVARVKAFFRAYGSILEQFSQDIVSAADTYGLDYRLLPAIAMQESQGGKNIVEGTNNPFGWGITSKQTIRFDTYSQAIETVSKFLAKNYIRQGKSTPEDIGKIYNPTNTNDWAGKVNYFMTQIQFIL